MIFFSILVIYDLKIYFRLKYNQNYLLAVSKAAIIPMKNATEPIASINIIKLCEICINVN